MPAGQVSNNDNKKRARRREKPSRLVVMVLALKKKKKRLRGPTFAWVTNYFASCTDDATTIVEKAIV